MMRVLQVATPRSALLRRLVLNTVSYSFLILLGPNSRPNSELVFGRFVRQEFTEYDIIDPGTSR